MSACFWIDGENVAPKTANEARALVGQFVEFVRKGRTDRYRGWACREFGHVEEIIGRNMLINGDPLMFTTILEMAIRAKPEAA